MAQLTAPLWGSGRPVDRRAGHDVKTSFDNIIDFGDRQAKRCATVAQAAEATWPRNPLPHWPGPELETSAIGCLRGWIAGVDNAAGSEAEHA
jgi:hypothetical protein